MKNKKIYFLSDIHLGSVSHNKGNGLKDEHELERKLCRWFDMVKSDAEKIFLMGDIFDFWFEYKEVVPRGFVRVLGKIAELTDSGIEVHFFIGNHDIWFDNYLSTECNITIHKEPLVTEIHTKKFFLAHGDGLGDNSKSFLFLRFLFRNKFCQKAFANIHPRWALAFAHAWSNHSRTTGNIESYLGEDKEHLVQFAKQHLRVAPNIHFFIFGHRHIMLDLMIAPTSRIIILGDWITLFSYGVFDGENFSLEIFE